MLKNISISDTGHNSGQGEGGLRSDPFVDLFEKLRSEINEMIDKNASVILGLPKVKGVNTHGLSEEDNKLLWRKENQ